VQRLENAKPLAAFSPEFLCKLAFWGIKQSVASHPEDVIEKGQEAGAIFALGTVAMQPPHKLPAGLAMHALCSQL